MNLGPKESAEHAINHANEETRKFILELASQRSRSQHEATLSLDQRITQASYLQFAAGAVAATVAGSGSITSPASAFAALATVAFVTGGAICFRGVKSSAYHAPGLPPAWWVNISNHDEFSLSDAQCWAAGMIQIMMDDTEKENVARANSLNLSLNYSLGGAFLIAIAALSRLVVA